MSRPRIIPPPLPRYTDFPHQGQINQGFVSEHENKLSEQAVVYSTRAGVVDEPAYIYFKDGDGCYTMLQTTGPESQYQKINNGPVLPVSGTQPLYQAINRGQLVPANNVTRLQVPQPQCQAISCGQPLPVSPGHSVSVQPSQIPYHVVNSEYTYPIVNRGQFVNPALQYQVINQGQAVPCNQNQGVTLQETQAIHQVANLDNSVLQGTSVVYSAAQQQCEVFDSRSPYKTVSEEPPYQTVRRDQMTTCPQGQLSVTECPDKTTNAANMSSSTLHASAPLHAIQTMTPVGSNIEMAVSRH